MLEGITFQRLSPGSATGRSPVSRIAVLCSVIAHPVWDGKDSYELRPLRYPQSTRSVTPANMP